MAERQHAKKATQKSAKGTTATGNASKGFTDEERAAMKERAQELKAAARADKDKADGESAVLAKVVCFFRGAHKFKERYAMFGFNDAANLDEGALWPVAFALKKLSSAEEARIGALVKKAVS